jgi:hypothetical protein
MCSASLAIAWRAAAPAGILGANQLELAHASTHQPAGTVGGQQRLHGQLEQPPAGDIADRCDAALEIRRLQPVLEMQAHAGPGRGHVQEALIQQVT